ncbi:T9SS type A sorting domain-containing protein [Flavobacterium sp. KS-LB2]|uniref:T9SS type A sorting domain-containing protein n=1 Tax=Flavobacterium sp. KS-LB2 TaxID=3120525 RepID=UPI0030D2837A
MKKFIFYTIKSVQKNVLTFSCYFNTGFSSLLWPNSITKKLFIWTTLLLLVFGQAPIYGQLVGGAAVKANFGIEADGYANLLQFGNFNPGPANTDDWFNSTYPGSGKGVIDISGAAALRTSILANNNFSFTKGQSVTTPAPGLPYPVVDGFLWIDSVYGRDTNSAQGNSDSSIFASSSDKNADNPITWSLGAGSVPQKDDIIDVMAHLRGTNPHDPSTNPGFPIDDRPFDVLWAYAAATLRSTDGSKHIDFEFFRTLVSYAPGDLVFGNTGNDGGRTAFTFNADGSVNVPGTIIVSIDYEGGGSKPEVRIRVWMDETVFNNYNNSAAARPFSVVPGTFEKGEQSGTFGYGRIVSNDPADVENIFGRVNAEASTLGPPWGTIEGPNATFFDNYQTLQHVEIGINLTAFGLDRKGPGSGPCANVLGSLLVKTRSSAGGQSDSFTSEQKDFAGPFPFGNTVTPTVSASVNRVITCTNTNATITATNIAPTGATIEWYNPSSVLIPGDNPQDPDRIIMEPGTYTVKVYAPGFAGCFAQATVVVERNITPPNANAGADKVLTCTVTSIALSGSSTTAGATFSWVASNGGNIVSGATTATPTVNAAGTYTLTVTDPANGCTATDVALVTLNNTPPNANAGADKVLTCTVTSIALSGSSTTAGATFSWVASNGGNIVSGATTATPTVNAAGTYTLTVTNPVNGCTATDVALVTLNNTPPNVNAGADKVLTCTVTSIALSGSSTTAGATFSWVASNGGNIVSGATTATPTVNAAGTYTLTVTNPANGCTATDVALVTLNNTPPNVSAGADKVLTCTFTSIALSGSSTTAGATFSWVASNGGNIVSGATTATPTVNAAGTYTLTVTNPANGCTATDIALVTLNNTPPNANAGADKVLTCTVTSIALSGSSTTAGATFSWVASNGGNIVSGATTATPTVNAAGTYTLTVTNPVNGCTATDVALVTLDANTPNVNAGADKVLTCTVTSIALSGSSTTAGATFSWVASNGGNIVSGATTATPTVNAAGTYTLTVTNPANGCTATDVALVTLNNTPPNVNAGADKVLTCTVTSIALSGSSTTAGATFSWVASNGGNIVSGATTATPTVNAAGTYTLTVTNPVNGCTATDIALVTLNNTPPNANAGADKVLTCTVTSIALSGSSTTAGATFSWVASNGGNIVSGATTATPTVNAAGTYTLTVTDPVNGCTATDIALVTLNNTPPNANAGADKVLTCTVTSIALSGSSTTAGATFSWVASNGGNIVSGATTATPTVNAAGTYTLTVTNPVNGCTATDIALVTLDNTPPNAVAGQDVQILCGNTTVTLSGSSSTLNVSYSWVATNGGNIVSGANTANPIVNHDGTYTLTVTSLANGCTATDQVEVTTQICAKALCTYTQGYYGNFGGMACAPNMDAGFDKYTTLDLIDRALAAYGGTMTIGSLGNTVIVTNTLTDRNSVVGVLPGGGSSYVLSGSYSISALPSSYLTKKGTINNTLLAQTITLGLNIGINGALGDFVLQEGMLVTAAAEGGCGSDIPKERQCIYDIYGNLTSVVNEYQYYSIDASVLAAIEGDKTVEGLFNLANKALGGGNTNGASLTSIASVVDKINNAFDGCRIFMGYNVPKCSATSDSSTNDTIAPIDAKIAPVGFDAYPVPFKDALTIKYKFDYVSDVKIDVLNSQGVSVLTKMDSNGYLNKEVTLNLNSYIDRSEVYVVKVTTNRGSSVKKVISAK